MLNGLPEGFAENSLEPVRQHRSTRLDVDLCIKDNGVDGKIPTNKRPCRGRLVDTCS